MKCLFIIALGVICYQSVAFAKEVKVEVRGIRSPKMERWTLRSDSWGKISKTDTIWNFNKRKKQGEVAVEKQSSNERSHFEGK